MRKGLNPSSVSLVAQSCPTLCDPMASLSITSSQSLLKLMSLEPVMPSNHLILSAVCSCLQSFLASGSFPVSQFFASGVQSIEASSLAWVLPVNTQGWFPLEVTGLNSLQSRRLSKSLLLHHSSKTSILQPSVFFMVQLLHPHMTTEKTIALTTWTFVSKVMPLLFNMLCR